MTDDLIDEWARARNGVLAGPTKMRHEGRGGQHGEWPISDYRRLLKALRLREGGVADVSTIRLRLRFAGIRIDTSYASGDLATAYRRILREARREVPLMPGSRLRTKPPLRLRREVERMVHQFQSGAMGLPTASDVEWLRALRGYANLEDVCVAIADLMYTGPERPVVERLQDVASLLPRSVLNNPAEIVEATALGAGSLAPADGTNLVLAALDEATAQDVLLADEFMRWLPHFLAWVIETSDQIDPSLAGAVKELCVFALHQLPRVPLEARVMWHAMLTACYVRFRKGEVSWAPGLAFAEKAVSAA